MIINVEKTNEVNLRVFADHSIEQDISQFFTFEVPGARFTPAFKARIWDGKIRMYDLHRKTLYVGLLDYLIKFAERNDYTIEYLNDIVIKNDISYEEVEKYTSELNLMGRGNPIEVRDYQIDAITYSLQNNRSVLLSPTGSGKSLIIYSLMRWHLDNDRKCLIVVPTTSLVEQLFSDFEDYSSGNGWSTSDNCQKLYSGFTKEFNNNVLLTTWQSIFRQPKNWFDEFDVLFGDEAHQFKAKSLTSIMEKMTDTKYRIGTTGSLDDSKINKLVLEGVFGPTYKVTTTKALMDNNKLAELKISAIILKYDIETRKANKGMTYQEEMKFIIGNEKRNKFIRNLTVKSEGNTLLLFQFVEKHGKILYDMINSVTHEDRKVFFIHGGTEALDRENIRHVVEKESNAIIIASFGVFSTGINIPSIENIIFASPSKSKIRNLQSIGRGLRLKDGKTVCNLYDIADDLIYKASKNHTIKHAAERYKLYQTEEFSVKLIEVKI